MAEITSESVLEGITDEGQRESVTALLEQINSTAETNIGNLQSKFDTKASEDKEAYRKLEIEMGALSDKGEGGKGSAELSETAKEITARHQREDIEAKDDAKVTGLEAELAGYRTTEFTNLKAQYKEEGMPDDLLSLVTDASDAKKFHALWKTQSGEPKKGQTRAGAGSTGTINRSTGSNNELTETERTSNEMSTIFGN